MDIVQDFIKASLKEANRSEASIAYNSNLSRTEKLAIILAKSLNGKILRKTKYDFLLQFSLPQNYSLEVNDDFRGSLSLNERCIFYWKNLNFTKDKDINYLTDEAKDCENKYKVPVDVSLAALKIASKIISIKTTFNNQNLSYDSVDKKSTKARRNLEKYKKRQAYYRDLFIKSKAISEEDLEKYIISIKPEDCDDGDWDNDSARFTAKIAFIFRDRATQALYKFIYDVDFDSSADGWYSAGSYWEPPDGESWLVRDVNVSEAYCEDIQSDNPVNEEFEEHITDILDKFCESGMLDKYIEDNLEDVTGQEVR